jgi:hypothetical protein
MKNLNINLAYTGMALGAFALLLALVHFWAGPFTPQPTLEEIVAEKAVAIRDATVAALKGEQASKVVKAAPRYDLDELLMLATAVMGGMAIIFGVFSFAMKASGRAAGGAVVLGTAALAYQFAMIALGVLVVVILVSAVLGELDFSL